MAIAQLPKRKPSPSKEEAAAAKFIEGAATAALRPGVKRTPAMIRFDAELLARVDKAAKRRGVSRSAWVAFTLSKALDDEEQTAGL
jgi:predicted HicB family RNase H-like nuclease